MGAGCEQRGAPTIRDGPTERSTYYKRWVLAFEKKPQEGYGPKHLLQEIGIRVFKVVEACG